MADKQLMTWSIDHSFTNIVNYLKSLGLPNLKLGRETMFLMGHLRLSLSNVMQPQ